MKELRARSDFFVSAVLVLAEDQSIDELYLRRLSAHLEECFSDYEIILIDQRSSDRTHTDVERLLAEIASIRLIMLAAPVHADVAWAAGLENAIGDFVVMLVPGQDPPECVFPVVRQCRTGSDIVYGIAEYPQSLAYRLARPVMQWVLKLNGCGLPQQVFQLCCLSRRAVNTVLQTGKFYHQLSVRISKSGYSESFFNYSLLETTPRQTLVRGIRQVVRILIFNSTKPLRWMSAIGFAGSFLAFLFATYSLVIRFFKHNVVEGWTSMILFMSVLFMLLFVILAFFGEYLGRLLDERQDSESYSVFSEKTSAVMLKEDRNNVLFEATTDDVNLVQVGRRC